MHEFRQLHANTHNPTLWPLGFHLTLHWNLSGSHAPFKHNCSDSQLLEFCRKKITCVSAFKSQHCHQPASSPCSPFIFSFFLQCVCLVCVSSGSQLNYWRRWCCAIGRSGRAGLQSQVPCFKHLTSPGSAWSLSAATRAEPRYGPLAAGWSGAWLHTHRVHKHIHHSC